MLPSASPTKTSGVGLNIRLAARKCSAFVLLLLVFLVPSCKHRSTAEFILIKDPVIALTHIRVIDGTGTAPREDQTIIIDSGRIAAIGPTAGIAIPASATPLDLSGHTAIPGLVGMHDHLFYTTDKAAVLRRISGTFATFN